MGGVGKTQLAVEYAHANRDDFDVIWTVRADQPAFAVQDYAALAAALHLPGSGDPDQAAVAELARDWLADNRRWLLIYDNASDLAAVDPLLPDLMYGRAIVTSRNPTWPARYRTLHVDVLDPEPAAGLLMSRTGDSDQGAATALASELGGLPLALEQAASYCAQAGRNLAGYTTLYRMSPVQLLQRPAEAGHPTVARTVSLGGEQVRMLNPAAAALLDLLAYMAPDPIPRSFFSVSSTSGEAGSPQRQLADHQGSRSEHTQVPIGNAVPMLTEDTNLGPAEHLQALQDVLKPLERLNNDLLVDDALVLLHRYGLIHAFGDNVTVHRLVQTVVRAAHSPLTADAYALAAAVTISNSLPELEHSSWTTYQQLLPHMLSTAAHLSIHPDVSNYGLLAISLLVNAGTYLRDRGQYGQALAVHEEALRLAEQVLPPDDPYLTTVLNVLGITLISAGDPDTAQPLLERALSIASTAHDNPDVLTSLNNLGVALSRRGDVVGAQPLLEEALAIAETAYQPDDPALINPLTNLGAVLLGQGEVGSAQQLLERAVHIAEAARDAPSLYGPLTTYAAVLRDRGDLDAAQPYVERALALAEATFDSNHPNLIDPLGLVAGVLIDRGKSAEAQPLLERAIAIAETTFGADHVGLVSPLNLLAWALVGTDKPADALLIGTRALNIAEGARGPDHHEITGALRVLATALRNQGKPIEAATYLKRSLTIEETFHGPDHSRLLKPLMELAYAYYQASDNAALPVLERALQLAETTSGPGSPETQNALRYLAGVLRDLGQSGEALPYQERVVAISEQADPADPDQLAADLVTLADLRRRLGQPDQAQPVLERALQLAEATHGPGSQQTLAPLSRLGHGYLAAKDFDQAVSCFSRALATTEACYDPSHPETTAALRNLVQALRAAGRAGEALPYQERVVAISEQADPEHAHIQPPGTKPEST
jgi:tetratricopeptide (TPR) repeat protein